MSVVWHEGMTLNETEKEILETAFRRYEYNKTVTARILGLSLRGLDGKLQKHGIKRPEESKNTGAGEAKSDIRATDSRVLI